MKQINFDFIKKINPESGGAFFKGRRKSKRTLAVKTPIHLVLKSKKARGQFSFVNHQRKIENVIDKISTKHGVKVYAKAINFDHIHVVLVLRSFGSYLAWIRELTKEIVLLLSKLTKTHLTNFFTLRPYTRLLTWGRQFKQVLEYLILNKMEVFGLRPKKKPKKARPSLSP